jgi:hypothetical protein
VSLHDDRYLPFEFYGAVSRWRIELPRENNYFAMDTLSDIILHLNYTSREGGERLRHAAREAAEGELPGEGWCFFDLCHDFADAWELFHPGCRDHRRHCDNARHPACEHRNQHDEDRSLILRFSRRHVPVVPGHRELSIEKMAPLFDHCEHCGFECPGECPCCADPTPATYEVEWGPGHGKHQRFPCVLSDHWPGLYHGVVETHVGPLHPHGERTEVKLHFRRDVCCIPRAYLLCRYKLEDKCPKRKEPPPLRCNPCNE